MIPPLSKLPGRPKRIVAHWTAGSYKANSIDLAAYHFLIEGDERIRAGKHPVAANMRRVSGEYAQHTGGNNSFTIGVSFCAMRDRQTPIREGQWRRGIVLLAALCHEYGLDASKPDHLCTHMEVWTIHKIKGTQNHQKVDINWLAFKPELKPHEVGPYMRAEVAKLLKTYQQNPPVPRLDIIP